MASNRSILEKADLRVQDLITSGGILPEAVAQKFIEVAVKESVIMGMATVVPMKSREQRIDTMRFGSRVLQPGYEATALPVAQRSKPDLTKSLLQAKLLKAEIRMSKEVLEDNIEGDGFQNHIITAAGKAVARDMDELISNGDILSADPFLAVLDGIRKQATTNTVAAGTVNLSKTILKSSMKTMPVEFLRDRRQLSFLTSMDAETDYRDSLADRATAVGDRFLLEGIKATYAGVPISGVPIFPENLGGGTNETEMLLLDPKNIHVGIWRQIEWETDKDIMAGELIIVVSLRMDVKFAYEPAVVKTSGIKVT